MKYIWIALAAGGLLSGCTAEKEVASTTMEKPESVASAVMLKTQTPAPVAKKVPHEMTAHGVTRTDNYYWMRDDSRTDEEILAHLEKKTPM